VGGSSAGASDENRPDCPPGQAKKDDGKCE
jgi:hypothetical protein